MENHFQRKYIEHAYVHVNEFELYARYINEKLSKVLSNPYLSKDKKHKILYRTASYIMQRILNDPRSGKNIQMGLDFMEMFSQYVVKSEVTASMLARIFSKNYELFSHSLQVALLTAVFCRFLKKDVNFILLCGLGALFHDSGRLKYPKIYC
jgi:HD-GYP domain-containing protein (c-di-GMP phosphodiesterase class II)